MDRMDVLQEARTILELRGASAQNAYAYLAGAMSSYLTDEELLTILNVVKNREGK